MKNLIYALGALALLSGAAQADPMTRNTITSHAASAAVAESVPLDPTSGSVGRSGRVSGDIVPTRALRDDALPHRPRTPGTDTGDLSWDADKNGG